MSINGFALVSDLPENIEVLKGSCATFETGNVDKLEESLQYYLNADIESERSKTKMIVDKHYSWESISDKYLELFQS